MPITAPSGAFPQTWTTGPAHLYAGVGGASLSAKTPLYLGTAETKPDIDIEGAYEALMNDLGGSRMPFDRSWQAEEGAISFVLTRWDYGVALRMMCSPNYLANAAGDNLLEDVGSLMGMEGNTFPFWVVFPKQLINPYTRMPAGFRFWSCVCEYPRRLEPGTRPHKIGMVIRAQRAWPGTASSPIGLASTMGNVSVGSILYDFDMSGLPAAG